MTPSGKIMHNTKLLFLYSLAANSSPPNYSSNSSSSNLAPKRSHPGGNGTFKDIQGREKLMEVGSRVEKMLQDPDTPNETKLKGFAQVLLDEWSKGIFS